MSNVLRILLLSSVLSSTFGCTFFQLDSEDLKVPPPKPEAAAGKAAEAAAGMSTTGAGGMEATGAGGMPGASGANTGGQTPAGGSN